jgi:hypothetical protein
VVEPSSLSAKARIISRPDPLFTRADIKDLRSAQVFLAVVLGENGTVGPILIVADNYNLARKAIEAARQIQFEPAQKDGHPVSTTVVLQYNFMKLEPVSK